MKILTIISVFVFSITINAQVVIGGSSGNASSPSLDLELADTDKGLILPYVSSAADVDAQNAVPGTLIFDTSDNKVKLRKNNEWFDYSLDDTGSADTTSQTNLKEDINASVKIGSNVDSDTAPGVLVLTSTNKAMLLPKVVDPQITIKSPSSGMMVYDPSTHKLCMYNGSKWSFWQP